MSKRGNAEPSESAAKRARGNAPSFLPPKDDLKGRESFLPQPNRQPSSLPPRPSSASTSAPSSSGLTPDQIAAKRAEVAAKIAALQRKSVPGVPSAMSSAAPSRDSLTPAPSATSTAPGLDPALAKRIAEAKRNVQAMAAKRSLNPYLSPKDQIVADPKTGLHPLLAKSSVTVADAKRNNKDKYKPMAPKFSTTRANARIAQPVRQPIERQLELSNASVPSFEEARKNPYFDKRLGVESLVPKERKARPLRFNPKGKFAALADQLRAEARMEELKARILESARKAGLEDEIELTEKQAKRPPPPDIEWWDSPFLPNQSYSDLDNGATSRVLQSNETPITIYVQHPIPIPAPADRIKVDAQPLKLTQKEMKKMRKQRRQADLQDRRDRIKLGLLPPDPPKVKLANMMRVLTQQAISDPTKVEAKVRREMTARKVGHEKANAARQLTDDQRREKLEAQKDKDASKGISAAVYRIRYLTNPSHRFKVRKNAQQLALTGITLYNPKFAFVFVEGGQASMKKYKHLMLDRINWKEEAEARDGDEDEEATPAPLPEGTPGPQASEIPESLANNRCDLVWEGPQRDRYFVDFKGKGAPSDGLAKSTLGTKLESLWDMCKRLPMDDQF
ncbi:uncharacterized protein L969DRAFT_17286 [Mixia osmundae IAM 14324]|uniref:Uncharacterized protein n=1 Tax=Mixia osmundae (strain CBS 9802 / IAM 14324 / JCM 22182 / KY 12970) TaxID=764103 RepID=G7E3G5_MIXOS|nr:uncharacterized protein L969DRAFT_17286 [Mixia osmundae IAM 14324]KEI39362.1 hypothetical protein L969DRAFT_17286 [Mixia osmundae IAM 14324]GAA97375.1 hypothetical protein E5Q_04053 [Mixia osmundae IAM 14324]